VEESHDGVILGSGHNALVLQAYLARGGLDVLCLERASVPGGGLATIENPRLPGFPTEDLGLEPWWNPPDIEEALARGAPE
jgi:hypothetical protein